MTNLEQVRNFSPLDVAVTDAEVSEAIKYIKNGKAAGPDLIRNEMIKYGHNSLAKPITKMFNLVLNSGYYPDNWSIGRIVSIHKKMILTIQLITEALPFQVLSVNYLPLFSIIDYAIFLKLRTFCVRSRTDFERNIEAVIICLF